MLIRKAKRRIGLKLKLARLKRIQKSKSFKPENSILIFGDPRGGSTWLAELLLNIEDSFLYWEPLAVNQIKELQKLNFGSRQYIPNEAEWKEARQYFRKILSVGVINEWTTQKISVREFSENYLPIIKFCRGNDLIGWLVNQFRFIYKPIYLVRHPFAVVASQLKHGGWDYPFVGFTIPEVKYNDKYLRHKPFLSQLRTKEEALVAKWCISNIDSIKGSDKWITIYYEDLLRQPKLIVEDIVDQWGLKMNSGFYEKLNLESSTNVDYIPSLGRQAQLEKWQNFFTIDQLQRLQRVLEYFGVTVYSMHSFDPSTN